LILFFLPEQSHLPSPLRLDMLESLLALAIVESFLARRT
jgi:hypothetical protein